MRSFANASADIPIDPLTAASVAVARVVVANKPFYPLYVWWFVGGGFEASLVTLIAAPFYAAAAFFASRAPLAARFATPLTGVFDSLLAAKTFGEGSGAELFLFACGLLAALSFRPSEAWFSRGLIGFIFAAFLGFHQFGGGALYDLPRDQLYRLLELNMFSAASLFAFIGLRFAHVSRA